MIMWIIEVIITGIREADLEMTEEAEATAMTNIMKEIKDKNMEASVDVIRVGEEIVEVIEVAEEDKVDMISEIIKEEHQGNQTREKNVSRTDIRDKMSATMSPSLSLQETKN